MSYTREIADEICRRLEAGEPIAKICKSDGMPSLSTVRNWTLADPDGFGARYQAAREAGGVKPAGAPFAPGQSGNPSGRPKTPDDVKRLMQENTFEAVEVVIKLWKDETQPGMVRLTAAKDILDRVLGKANQKIEHSGQIDTQALPDDKLDSRITQLLGKIGTALALGGAAETDIQKEALELLPPRGRA